MAAVLAPARSGPNSTGTTSPSNRQRMLRSGRTQRISWSPQRIDFGQGKRARIGAEQVGPAPRRVGLPGPL